MIYPALDDPFNLYYDQYSINYSDLSIPYHFDAYQPDLQNDPSCILVISPNISKGATKWTLNGTYITIGIYHDAGRPISQRPIKTGLTWSRNGLFVTITDPDGHKLKIGDILNITDINVSKLSNVKVEQVINLNSFVIKSSMIGSTSGTNASYKDNFLTDFYKSRVVFRLLPSFNLVPYSVIQSIFSSSISNQVTPSRSIDNITSGVSIKIPTIINSNNNYELLTKVIPKDLLLPLNKLYNQVYDENGIPLKLSYNHIGLPVPTNNIDYPNKNSPTFNTAPINPLGDLSVNIYDYYGIPLNDINRGPSLSTTNVSRNIDISGNINNILVTPLYKGILLDIFGNLVVGIQSNNGMIVKKQMLPLILDNFNRPLKNPL